MTCRLAGRVSTGLETMMADTAQGIGKQRVFELRREYAVGYMHADRVAGVAAMTEEQARAWFEKARQYADETYARRQSTRQTRRGGW